MQENTDIKRPRVLESTYVFQRPWLTARRDKLLMPNGAINPEFYVLEYPAWVNVIAITDDDRFVMVSQYRHGLGVISTELCAGVVEDGEDPLDAAKRELLEETGYQGGEWQLQCVISGNPSTSNNLTYCYLARGVKPTGHTHLDTTEDIATLTLSRSELLDMMMRDEMKQALMLAPLWRYFFLTEKNSP
ncbi:MAG: NUDIX hydrolase [Firmicutes bacterium]|nr:NUDIX hydrolase [Bacillota bacterium]MCM1400749.1 NUDIX hydrolase [Bacteroides sp.]MCM1476832.1 NUDIX hydrolase [Bacteroides sp.]